MSELRNITYDELQVNDYATFTRPLTEEALILYAVSKENHKSLGLDINTVKKSLHQENIGYGMWVCELISTAFLTVIPGPGTIHLEQDLKFQAQVELQDTLTVKLNVTEKQENNRVLFSCEVFNQEGELVVSGTAKVVAPSEKIALDQTSLPQLTILNNKV